jgi:YidC/Oxa1 family membrane protein insertase
LLNKHFQKLDIDDIIRKNQEKARKKREKMGLSENQISNAARIKTKSMNSVASITETSADKEVKLQQANEVKSRAKAGSMASKANLVKDYNERNNKK